MSDTPQPTPQQRLRIVYGKIGAFKYIGHLDLAKTWERILRRAQISLAYSQGFNARPKMQLAAPLPVGCTSECELMDIWLDQPILPEALPDLAGQLMAVSPPGLPIYHIREVPPKSPALQTLTRTAIYLIRVDGEESNTLPQRCESLLAQPHILRTRRDKQYDLRPLIKSLEVDSEGRLRAELSLSETQTGRADELIAALGLENATFAIHRAAITLSDAPVADASTDPLEIEGQDTESEVSVEE